MMSSEGLPVEFWRVLEVLADERGRSMSELAAETGMQLPATSKLVDRMTEAALVQRSADPADQRRVILHVSDFGLQKVAALERDVREHRDRIGRAFGPRASGAADRAAAGLHPGSPMSRPSGRIPSPST